MSTAQRIRILRSHGFPVIVVAAILNIDPQVVAANALDPNSPAGAPS